MKTVSALLLLITGLITTNILAAEKPKAAPVNAKEAYKQKQESLAPEISLQELQELIERKDKKPMAIIDANSAKSYKEGHIPGAIHYATVEANLASALPADKNALIVAYCGGPLCTAWEAPAEKIKALGYTNIRHLKAGIKGWKEAKYRTQT